MTQYVAKTNTGIYPFGIVRKGDVLEQKHLDALGETGLSVLIANGVIGEVQENGATSSDLAALGHLPLKGKADEEAAKEPEEVEPEEEDFEDGETLTDLEGLDELDGEAEGETTSSDPAAPGHLPLKGKALESEVLHAPEGEGKKPRSRKRTGGKKQ